MAKPQDDTSGQDPVAVILPVPITSAVKFRDALYTSRTVVLPDGRTLPVVKSLVMVEAGDDVALKYLKAHPEYEQLKE
ncbi:hypothetical protein [Pseudomonas sp. IAC-BECa141]|uniref:hypothetical protein n=1 Tax=Pseudomonas sp. IAC-BECa141 TaxID=2793103 RepID=UPI001D08F6B0|nr:hypothetical protein [Pseudomonas sp. IAC-BECa141]UDI95759.1 hypothetical protein I5961_08840 [Pseudomonas sp. IAC-BECa141]